MPGVEDLSSLNLPFRPRTIRSDRWLPVVSCSTDLQCVHAAHLAGVTETATAFPRSFAASPPLLGRHRPPSCRQASERKGEHEEGWRETPAPRIGDLVARPSFGRRTAPHWAHSGQARCIRVELAKTGRHEGAIRVRLPRSWVREPVREDGYLNREGLFSRCESGRSGSSLRGR